MFFLIKDHEILWSSNNYIESEWCITLLHDFSKEEQEKISLWYNIKIIEIWIQSYFKNEELNKKIETPVEYIEDWKKIIKTLIKNVKVIEKVEKTIKKYECKLYESEQSVKNEKNIIINHYKDIQKEIREMTWDVQDLEWRLDTMSESQKALANKRITILKDKIANKRTDSDSVALMWIKKYGESIIKEL